MLSANLTPTDVDWSQPLGVKKYTGKSLFGSPVETLFTWPVKLHGSVYEEPLCYLVYWLQMF